MQSWACPWGATPPRKPPPKIGGGELRSPDTPLCPVALGDLHWSQRPHTLRNGNLWARGKPKGPWGLLAEGGGDLEEGMGGWGWTRPHPSFSEGGSGGQGERSLHSRIFCGCRLSYVSPGPG